MTEKNSVVFEKVIRMARVLVKMYGSKCEVAIHDFLRLPNSVIHIEGNVTTRKPGAPVTDLVLRGLRAQGDDVLDLPAYRNKTRDGRILKSSTTFLRDDSGGVIGAFCINMDVRDDEATSLLIKKDLPWTRILL